MRVSHSITRRNFLAATGSLAYAARSRAAGRKRTVLFICMDGCDPAYLKLSDVPNLKRMMAGGMYREGRCVMPSVTNVNNSSIATACFPNEHGITGNYYYDRATGKGTYMEAADFLLRPTIFEKARAAGYRPAFLSSKGKLLELISKGADFAASAEEAPAELQRLAGPRPEVYSPGINYWTFRAARQLLRQGYNFLYVSTTDYMMHTYAPDQAPSLEHMHEVDRLIGEILDDQPDVEIYMSADHAMNAKSRAVDLGRLLAQEGIAAEAVPIIKDRYVKHAQNLGGSSYIYLTREGPAAHRCRALETSGGRADLYQPRGGRKIFPHAGPDRRPVRSGQAGLGHRRAGNRRTRHQDPLAWIVARDHGADHLLRPQS